LARHLLSPAVFLPSFLPRRPSLGRQRFLGVADRVFAGQRVLGTEGSLEFEVLPSFLLSVSGHYYEDSGEIVNSLLLSSAAPGLAAWNYGLGARYLWPSATLKLFVGPYFTDYDPVEMGTRPFDHLYKDRDWWLAQLALDVQF
jgi:hypothetical protein